MNQRGKHDEAAFTSRSEVKTDAEVPNQQRLASRTVTCNPSEDAAEDSERLFLSSVFFFRKKHFSSARQATACC